MMSKPPSKCTATLGPATGRLARRNSPGWGKVVAPDWIETKGGSARCPCGSCAAIHPHPVRAIAAAGQPASARAMRAEWTSGRDIFGLRMSGRPARVGRAGREARRSVDDDRLGRLDLLHEVVVPVAVDHEVCGRAELDGLDQI